MVHVCMCEDTQEVGGIECMCEKGYLLQKPFRAKRDDTRSRRPSGAVEDAMWDKVNNVKPRRSMDTLQT